MKKTWLIFLALAYCMVAPAQTWKVDKNNTHIGFTAVHLLISDVHGSFPKYEMTLVSTADDFTDAQIDLSVEMASINTNVEMRDNNLRSASYLDTDKFPTMTFKSESLTKAEGKKYKLKGALTIHGITRNITLDVIFNGMAVSPANQLPIAGFKITGTFKRSDFKIGVSSAGVSEEIKIESDAEFFKTPKAN